jgi:type I restriction enzyme, S subunit
MTAIEGWVKTQLGKLVTLVKGVSYASEDYGGPGEGAHFITIKCVSKAGGFKPEGIKYYKGTIPESQRLWPGDLLIANTDLTRAGDIVGCPITVPSIDAASITMSMDLSKLIEDGTQVDQLFLYYTLMTDPVRRFMKDHASGSTVLHLQTRALPKLKLTIPKALSEQMKIAEVLSTVDRAIKRTEGLIAKQQRIKTGLMQDLLTRGIDEHGNLRVEESHKFKDSPLGRIPVQWTVRVLGEIAEIIDPNPSHRYPPTCDSGVPIASTENFEDDSDFDPTGCDNVPWSVFEAQLKRCKYSPTDVVFARKADLDSQGLMVTSKKFSATP